MSKLIPIVGILLLTLTVVLFFHWYQGDESVEDNVGTRSERDIGNSTVDQPEPSDSDESDPQDIDVANNNSPGVYVDYSEDLLENDERDHKVLFFYAKWCPSCRQQDENLSQTLDEIPSDLSIYKVDFDEETELRQKYGVTIQHTFVQIDNTGELIKKWNTLYQGSDLDAILDELVN